MWRLHRIRESPCFLNAWAALYQDCNNWTAHCSAAHSRQCSNSALRNLASCAPGDIPTVVILTPPWSPTSLHTNCDQAYEEDAAQLHDVVEVLGVMSVVPGLAAAREQQQQQGGGGGGGPAGLEEAGAMEVDLWDDAPALLPTSQVRGAWLGVWVCVVDKGERDGCFEPQSEGREARIAVSCRHVPALGVCSYMHHTCNEHHSMCKT